MIFKNSTKSLQREQHYTSLTFKKQRLIRSKSTLSSSNSLRRSRFQGRTQEVASLKLKVKREAKEKPVLVKTLQVLESHNQPSTRQFHQVEQPIHRSHTLCVTPKYTCRRRSSERVAKAETKNATPSNYMWLRWVDFMGSALRSIWNDGNKSSANVNSSLQADSHSFSSTNSSSSIAVDKSFKQTTSDQPKMPYPVPKLEVTKESLEVHKISSDTTNSSHSSRQRTNSSGISALLGIASNLE